MNIANEKDYHPWGYFHVLFSELNYKVKRIVVFPQKRLSLQRHNHRAEHWCIVYGEAVIILDHEQLYLKINQSVDIPLGSKHRIMNPGINNLILI